MSNTIHYHMHHKVPKHMGGSDAADNLVKLSVADHAEAHRKLFEQYGHYQDEIAWKALSGQINGQEAIRAIQSETMKNRVYTAEIRKNMSDGQMGKKYDRKGKCAEEKNNFYGKTHSDSTKEKMRQKKLGTVLSQEHKDNVGKALKGRPKPKLTCPHCGKIGGAPQMKRHHFDNCKEKNNEY